MASTLHEVSQYIGEQSKRCYRLRRAQEETEEELKKTRSLLEEEKSAREKAEEELKKALSDLEDERFAREKQREEAEALHHQLDQSVQVDGGGSTQGKLYYLYSQVILQQQAELEEVRSQLQQHSYLLAQKDTEISHLHCQLSQYASITAALPCWFSQIQLQLQHCQQEAHLDKVHMQQAVHRLEKTVASLSQELGAAHRQQVRLSLQVSRFQFQVVDLREENQALQSKLAESEKELSLQAHEIRHLQDSHAHQTSQFVAAQELLLGKTEEKDATISELQTICNQLAVHLLAVTAVAQDSQPASCHRQTGRLFCTALGRPP